MLPEYVEKPANWLEFNPRQKVSLWEVTGGDIDRRGERFDFRNVRADARQIRVFDREVMRR
jgi:hypothetical protein